MVLRMDSPTGAERTTREHRPGHGIDWPLWALAAAETIIWAGTFYLFPALLDHFETSLGWSKPTLTLGFSAALTVSALCSPFAGAIIDRGHGQRLLVGSSAGAALALVALAMVDGWIGFLGVWLVIGLCMAGCLYDPCFAWLVRTRGTDARPAITRVTLAAGFAGTLSFPLNNAVAASTDWRVATLVFAALIAFVAVPLFWYGTRHDEAVDSTLPDQGPAGSNGAGRTERCVTAPPRTGRPFLRRSAFWLLAFAFALLHMNHVTLVTHLLPMLTERGVELTSAVLVASLLGPSQVAGRLVMMSLERRVSIAAFGLLSLAFVCVAAMLVQFTDALLPALVLVAILQGAGVGMATITRPIIVAEILGRKNYGVVAGAIASAVMLATALAPFCAALIWSSGGYSAVLGANLAWAALALLALRLATRGS